MTFRRSAPAALITAIVVIVAGFTFISNHLFSGLTASVETGQFQLMQSIIDSNLNRAANEALARAEIVATLPSTRQAVTAKDRDKLLAEFSTMFTGQHERRGVDQAQFHVPPAVSLLRLHDPSQFGDDLTRFRPMVVAMNRERTAQKGLAIARQGPAIFGVAPIQDMQGNYVGSFEFGLEFAPLFDALKAAYGLDFTLFVEEKPLREFARGLDPAVLSDQNRVGRFIRFHTTNGALMKDLAGEADISAASEPTHYTREAQGLSYGVLLVPLRDNAGTPLGVVAVARDFSGSRAAAGRSLVWQICLAVLAVVILSGFVIVVIRGFLLRPLQVINERIAALDAGEPAAPIEGTDQFCAELRPLAAHYERLRTQPTRGA